MNMKRFWLRGLESGSGTGFARKSQNLATDGTDNTDLHELNGIWFAAKNPTF
jgi:hypothetical protein